MNLFSKLRQEGGFFRLPAALSLRITGEDRVRYLNGQVTADLRKLIQGQAIQACVLTPQGKLQALLSITSTENALFLESELELSEALISRLERYIIADDVQVELIEGPQKIHFFGAILNHPILQQIEGTKINRLGIEGKDIALLQLESLAGLGTQDSLSPEIIEAFRIAQGVPRWGYELKADMLPQEARLETTHIADQKGCYVGQEVVSRLKSIGHVNRLLNGFISQGDIPLAQGMELFANDNPSQPIGRLTSVAISENENKDEKKFIALGYLKRGYDTINTQVVAIDPETEVATDVTITSFPILG